MAVTIASVQLQLDAVITDIETRITTVTQAGNVSSHLRREAYNYDANGNLLSGGGRTYTWRIDNLPSNITGTDGVQEGYGYDGDGERIRKDRNGQTTIYLEGLWEEVIGGTQTQSILFGGQVVALRKYTPPAPTPTPTPGSGGPACDIHIVCTPTPPGGVSWTGRVRHIGTTTAGWLDSAGGLCARRSPRQRGSDDGTTTQRQLHHRAARIRPVGPHT